MNKNNPKIDGIQDCIIGEGTVLFERNLIQRQGENYQLPNKCMKILSVLVKHSPKSVKREHLLDEVWGQSQGSDELLNNGISKLRNALGKQYHQQTIIETVPKFGYRLTVEPKEISEKNSNPHKNKKLWIILSIVLSTVLVFFSDYLFTMQNNPNDAITSHDSETVPSFSIKDLTKLRGVERLASFSPDGQQLVFSQTVFGQIQADLYTQNLLTGEVQQITDNPFEEKMARWNHAGDAIAFLRFEAEKCTIFRLNLSSKKTQSIFDCTALNLYSLNWSPDDKYLISSWYDNEVQHGVNFKIDVQQHSATKMKLSNSDDRGNALAVYSPSGKFLAWINIEEVAKKVNIIVLDLTTHKQRLIATQHNIVSLKWATNDNKLYFSSNDGIQKYTIFALNLNNNAITELFAIDGMNTGISINPVSGDIAFDQMSARKQLLRINLKSGVSDYSMETSFQDDQPVYSRNGEQLLFRSNRSGKQGLWLRNKNGLSMLFDTDESIVAANWLDTDSKILYKLYQSSKQQHFIYDLETQSQILLEGLPENSVYPFVSKDGENIYFSHYQKSSKTTEIIQYQRHNSTYQVILNNAIYLKESSDGKWYYYNIPDKDGIWRKNKNTGTVELVTSQLSKNNFGNWQIIEQGVLFYVQSDDGLIIKSLDWDNKQLWQAVAIGTYLAKSGPNFTYNPRTHDLIVATNDNYSGNIKLLKFSKQ